MAQDILKLLDDLEPSVRKAFLSAISNEVEKAFLIGAWQMTVLLIAMEVRQK